MNEEERYSGIIRDREVRLVPVDNQWAVDVRIETGEREGEYVEGYIHDDHASALKDYNQVINRIENGNVDLYNA